MSPEQASADPHIDHRADIYAVGVIAYELLTGRTPFIGNTQQELLAAHVTETPHPVTKHRESVPPALAELVMKCLEKKPADRLQTADELLPQLEALTTPSGGMTPTGALPWDRVKMTGQNRLRYTVVAAGVLLVAALLVRYVVVPSLDGRSQQARAPLGELSDSRPSLAVLPFENRSERSEDKYFTDGVHDELLTRLAGISSLKTIARTSVEEYRDTPKAVREIGRELGVQLSCRDCPPYEVLIRTKGWAECRTQPA